MSFNRMTSSGESHPGLGAIEVLPPENRSGVFDHTPYLETQASTRLVSHAFADLTNDSARRQSVGVIDIRQGRRLPLNNPTSADCPYMTDDAALHHTNLILLCDDQTLQATGADGIVSMWRGDKGTVFSRFHAGRVMARGTLDKILLITGDRPLTHYPAAVEILKNLKAKYLIHQRIYNAHSPTETTRLTLEEQDTSVGTASALSGRFASVVQYLEETWDAGSPGVLLEHAYDDGPDLTVFVTDTSRPTTKAVKEAVDLLDRTRTTQQKVSLVLLKNKYSFPEPTNRTMTAEAEIADAMKEKWPGGSVEDAGRWTFGLVEPGEASASTMIETVDLAVEGRQIRTRDELRVGAGDEIRTEALGYGSDVDSVATDYMSEVGGETS